MTKRFYSIIIVFLLGTHLYAITPIKERPVLNIQTTKGDIVIRLLPDEAPITCKNFMSYVSNGFYNKTIVHRIIDGFIIQAGGFDTNYKEKKHKNPIINESRTSPSNLNGTVAMALTTDKNSAASQFFFNLADNTDLDYTTAKNRGYTVFAEVIEGHKTLNRIQKIRTKRINIYSERHKRNVPLYNFPETDVVIKKIIILRNKLSTKTLSKSTK